METIMKTNETVAEKANTRSLISGVVTGQIAGLIMAVVVMAVFTLFLGKGPLFPVQVIGSTFVGEEALQGTHIGAVLVGLLLHQLGPSLLWGAVFGLLANLLNINTLKQSLILGLIIGVVSMVGPYVLIPKVMNALQGQDFWNREVPMIWDWAAHIVFGVAFALFPAISTKLK